MHRAAIASDKEIASGHHCSKTPDVPFKDSRSPLIQDESRARAGLAFNIAAAA
jgi:hypothetical protein